MEFPMNYNKNPYVTIASTNGLSNMLASSSNHPQPHGSMLFDASPTSATYDALLASSCLASYHNQQQLNNEVVIDDVGNFEIEKVCAICGDRATGKHYGAFSCDGCKGFFRRSIRKNAQYKCQDKRKCVIDRETRNKCRYCRLNKCNQAGMKKDAVQSERDKISSSRRSPEMDENNLLCNLSYLEYLEDQLTRKYIDRAFYNKNIQIATKYDVSESMRMQSERIIEWINNLAFYRELEKVDQHSLLKSQIAELLVLSVIWRTYQVKADSALLLANGSAVTSNCSDPALVEFFYSIYQTVSTPFQKIQPNLREYAGLKMLILLHPYIKGISEHCSETFEKYRNQIHVELMNYMNDKQYDKPGRFGELLILLPELHAVSRRMLKKITTACESGEIQLDRRLSETLCIGAQQEHRQSMNYRSADLCHENKDQQQQQYNFVTNTNSTFPHQNSQSLQNVYIGNLVEGINPTGHASFNKNISSSNSFQYARYVDSMISQSFYENDTIKQEDEISNNVRLMPKIAVSHTHASYDSPFETNKTGTNNITDHTNGNSLPLNYNDFNDDDLSILYVNHSETNNLTTSIPLANTSNLSNISCGDSQLEYLRKDRRILADTSLWFSPSKPNNERNDEYAMLRRESSVLP